jgi:hypothetical protein
MFNFSLGTLSSALGRYGLYRVSGNEEIEAVFARGECRDLKPQGGHDYRRIMDYLRDLKKNSREYARRDPDRNIFKKIKRKISSAVGA